MTRCESFAARVTSLHYAVDYDDAQDVGTVHWAAGRLA